MTPPNHEHNTSLNPTSFHNDGAQQMVYPKTEPYSENINETNSTDSPLRTNSINSSHESLHTTDSQKGLHSSDSEDSKTWKGWKGMSPLEKSLSVSLGVCSTICVALMIAVLVVGLNRDCKTVINTTTPPPETIITSTQSSRCDTTVRPRPPRRGSGVTTQSSLTTGDQGASGFNNLNTNRDSCITPDQYNSTICLTPHCFNKASSIIEVINFNKNPCRNFYEFACGNFAKFNPIPSYAPFWSSQKKREAKMLLEIKSVLERHSAASDSNSFQLAQKFYHSCMHPTDDEVSLAEMKLLIDEMTASLETDPLSFLGAIFPNIRSSLSGNYIVSLEIDVNDNNTKENAVYLDRPSFGLADLLDFAYYEDDDSTVDRNMNGTKNQALYREVIKKLWLLVFPGDDKNVDAIVTEVLEFEENLINISTREATRDSSDILPETLDGTRMQAPMSAWLNELVKNVIRLGVGNNVFETNAEPNIFVKDVGYFESLDLLLNQTSTATIKKYMQFRILLEHGPHCGEDFRNIFAEFEKKIVGHNLSRKSRWQNCVEQTNEFFGWTLSYELIQDGLMDANIDLLNETANYVNAEISESLNGFEWITSNETKRVARRKLDLMQILIAYPDWLYASAGASENAALESFYTNMNFTDPSNYFQNYIEMKMWLSRKSLLEIYDSTTESEPLFAWPKNILPTGLKSKYLENVNAIVFPSGAISETQAPSTDDSDIFPLLYGSFGITIAQNILRGIDDRGSLRDEHGNIRKWWDDETLYNYKNLSSCLRDQYTSLQDDGASLEAFDETMLRELILTDGAVNLAYLAYQSQVVQQELEELLLPGLQDYSPEQLFFLAFAQTQCSASLSPKIGSNEKNLIGQGEFLLQAITRNSPEFAKQWKCTLPTTADSCRIF